MIISKKSPLSSIKKHFCFLYDIGWAWIISLINIDDLIEFQVPVVEYNNKSKFSVYLLFMKYHPNAILLSTCIYFQKEQ